MILLQDHITITVYVQHTDTLLTLFSKHRLFTAQPSTKLCGLDPWFGPAPSELWKNAFKETAFKCGLSNAVFPPSFVSLLCACRKHRARASLLGEPAPLGAPTLPPQPAGAAPQAESALGIILSWCCLTTSALLNPKESSKQNLLSWVPQSSEKQQTCWVKCKVSSIFIWLIRIAHQMKTKKWFTAEPVQVVVA